MRTRWRLCPFDAVAEHVPADGRILDFGCGYGLFSAYLHGLSPDRRIVGVDIDANKIAVARAAAGEGMEFHVLDAAGPPPGPYDCAVVVDVLYLMDRETQRETLKRLVSELAPAGTLVVKEMSLRPRWKHWWDVAEEFLAVRVLRITQGSTLVFASPDELAGWLRDLGLQVKGKRVDRGYVHPHYLTRAVRR